MCSYYTHLEAKNTRTHCTTPRYLLPRLITSKVKPMLLWIGDRRECCVVILTNSLHAGAPTFHASAMNVYRFNHMPLVGRRVARNELLCFFIRRSVLSEYQFQQNLGKIITYPGLKIKIQRRLYAPKIDFRFYILESALSVIYFLIY